MESTIYNNFGEKKIKNKNEYKVYRRRWLILFLFILFAISNFLHYAMYPVIAHIITEYYQVSYEAVNWTTLVTSVVSIIISIPGIYVIDRIGIRKTVIIGIIGTSLGSWIKVASIHPDRIWIIYLGQGIISAFQICIFPLLPKIAATWFGNDQISTAFGLGFTGIQVGMALSFLIPPLIVHQGEVSEVTRGLYILNIAYGVFTTIMIPLIIIFFINAPPTPPSLAQQHIVKGKLSKSSKSFFETCKILVFIKPYMLYLIIFGMNVGIFIPIQILSNQIIMSYYSDAEYHVGIIGLLQTLLSIVGSVGVAIILDKYKKFKITCWIFHFLNFVALIFYYGTIDQGLAIVYVSSVLIGIRSGALMTLGFEIIVEFTYPEAENISTGIAYNIMGVISLVFTILGGRMFDSIEFIWIGLTAVLIIFASDLLFFVFKFDLRRKTVEDSQSKTEVVPISKLTI